MASSSDENAENAAAAASAQESSSSSEEDLAQPPPVRRIHTAEGSFEEGRKVRIGPQFQVDLPPWTESSDSLPPGGSGADSSAKDKLIWTPGTMDDSLSTFVKLHLEMLMLTSVTEYLDLMRSMYGERDFSVEQALRALQHHSYQPHFAMMQMMEHPLPAHREFDSWESDEVTMFERGLRRYGKDFRHLANYVETRGIKDVITMYYHRKSRILYQQRIKNAVSSARSERIARREQQRLKDDARRRPTSSQGNDILSNASYATASASATPQTHNGLATTEHTTGVKRAFAEEPET